MEQVVTIGTIEGTLTLPIERDEKLVDIVLILPGSGTVDRNGNVAGLMGTSMRIYQLLSDFLVQYGNIGSLRYDKRGVGNSKGDFHSTGFWDFVDDALLVYRWLLKHKRVQSVILAGHSEGGFTIAAMYQKLNPTERPKAVIFLSGFGYSFTEILEYQKRLILQSMDEAQGIQGWFMRTFNAKKQFLDQNDGIIKRIKESKDDVIKQYFFIKINAKWFREFMDFDVVPTLAGISCPVLVIGGGKDIQVPACSELKAKELLPKCVSVNVEIIEMMNHLLRDQKSAPNYLTLKKDYNKSAKEDLSPSMLEITRHFITQIVNNVKASAITMDPTTT